MYSNCLVWCQVWMVAQTVKNLPAMQEGLIPGLERYSGEGNGYPLQYSCLENSMDKELGGLQSMGSQRVTHTEHFHYFTSSDLLFVKWLNFSRFSFYSHVILIFHPFSLSTSHSDIQPMMSKIWFIFVPISTYMQILENSLSLYIASQSSTFIWTLPICIVPIINIVVFLFAILQINKNVYKNFLHIQTFFLKFLLNSIWSCFVREFLYLNRILIWDEY